MCGIAGAYLRRAKSRDALLAMGHAMSTCIAHRGPDDSGHFVDAESGALLAFRRLAIIDLSEAGHQPMESPTGRYVLIFNGEAYNFNTVRAELEELGAAPRWRGHSDTEVLLAAIERWGLEDAVGRFVGMFAFAVWDRQEKTLHLVRDRVGVKPLYYSIVGDAVLFGSELKAMASHPLFRREIDRDAVALYARFGYVPGPHTIYRHTFKLPPGGILTIPPGTARPEPHLYWSVPDAVARGKANPFRGGDAEALEALDELLKESVGLRMISDVPLGVFLSGGIDSSIVTAQMQRQARGAVKTFSIGLRESGYDEARYARAVAKHLGTDHTEFYVTPREAMDVIPMLPHIYDEPFADSSQIPTYLVSKLARQSVTVSLSGDGGDELFGGYNRYFLGRSLWKTTRRIPRPLRPVAGAAMRALPAAAWNRMLAPLARAVPALRERAGDRLHKLSRAMNASDQDALYRELVTQWRDAVPNAQALPLAINTPLALDDITERMMAYDQMSYMVDDVLVKVDRASMAVSLEAREPLLDHRLIELAWRLPLHMKVRDGKGKWLLRTLLARYVPDELIERPKMGFAIPIDSWLRGPLREWAETLLDERRLREEGFFDAGQVRKAWRSHLKGGAEWQQHLWTVLMFQAWLTRERPGL
ncbi:MAG TPA: asparagine synthase (glutamine-hydrolyzing) [Thermoanaerobaculia bacterium]|nr:asparagine synthase (glutamine-hydrolyzing) [Thermoanaerobaculia bacterium]